MFQVVLVFCLQFQPQESAHCDRIVGLQYSTYKQCMQELEQYKTQKHVRWAGCVWERTQGV
jgi:hypothetical protein